LTAASPRTEHHTAGYADLRHFARIQPGGVTFNKKEFPMRALATVAFTLCLVVQASAQTAATKMEGTKVMPTTEDIRSIAPVLEKYAKGVVLGDLWKRPGLSARDRSVVTVAALIARDQTVELPYYLNVALDNGVKPAEISEIITHLAFYTGWANAIDAIPATKDVFKSRNIGADQLPPASGPQLPLDEAAESQRATRVGQQFGQITPSLVQYTTDVLFRDLWLRPGLAPRDRSLVTVSALVATGQVAQITYHLNRAMDNGLTKEEAGEVVGHLAFYAGWPNAFSAAPVVKEVIEKRPR
jgi:4-carboxymuconolactone decarboxylase